MPVFDCYLSERYGIRYEDQSATEFNICTHGSEACNCDNQRPTFFFSFGKDLDNSHLQLCNKNKKTLWQGWVVRKPVNVNPGLNITVTAALSFLV